MDGPALGDRCRDIASGRVGVLTGYCEYLWGCEQFLMYVEGEKDKEGSPMTAWMDVGRLDVVERGKIAAFSYARAEVVVAEKPKRKKRRSWTGPDVAAPVR